MQFEGTSTKKFTCPNTTCSIEHEYCLTEKDIKRGVGTLQCKCGVTIFFEIITDESNKVVIYGPKVLSIA